MLYFKNRIKSKKIKISVVGLGYVGFPLAIEFAKKGYKVFGIDTDKDRINHIKNKCSYITDVSDKDLRQVIKTKKLDVSTSFKLLSEADVIIICVPTPLKMKYQPDISFVVDAVNSIARHMKKGSLVILESTTYPGTTEEVILPIFTKNGLKHGEDFYLCFSPERIDPGNKSYPVNKIPKVIGGISKEATLLGKLVYNAIIKKVVSVSGVKVAETAKLLENTFRLVNIALIDEITMMAQRMNINIWEVIDAASTKPFGFMPFYPGPGVGGFCIPKDPMYLYWKAKEFGFKSRFIKLAKDTISSMPQYVVGRLSAILKGKGRKITGSRILIVGVTYKKDVKDLRKSPALDIIEILQRKNARVFYYDPFIPYLKLDSINLTGMPLSKDNLKKIDCVVIATDHTKVDYGFILRNSALIFDTRNVYRASTDKKIVRL